MKKCFYLQGITRALDQVGENLVPFIQIRSKRDALEKWTFAKSAGINSNGMSTQAFKCMCLQFKDKPFMFIIRQWTIWFGCDLTALSENYLRPNINIYSKSAQAPTRGMPNILFIFNAHFPACINLMRRGEIMEHTSR